MKIKFFDNLSYVLLAFFFCFMLQFQSIKLANVIFLLFFIARCGKVRFNRKALVIFGLFLAEILLSTVIFSKEVPFGLRSLFQLAFNLQYLFFIVDFDYDNEKLDKYIHFFSIVLAAWIVFAYFVSGTAFEFTIIQLQILGRKWGEGLISGWPNESVLPILYGSFLNLFVIQQKEYRKWLIAGFLCIALFLTTSRSGMLGAGAIISFALLSKFMTLPAKTKKIILAGVGACALAAVIVLVNTPALLQRLFFFGDRQEISAVCYDYFTEHPLLGYGGNTLDVLQSVFPTETATINWGHTHNTIWELLIRYGILGCAFFLLMLWAVFCRIQGRIGKLHFLLFWFLSLFQIYFRNFIFLMIIFFIIKRYTNTIPDNTWIEIDISNFRRNILKTGVAKTIKHRKKEASNED